MKTRLTRAGGKWKNRWNGDDRYRVWIFSSYGAAAAAAAQAGDWVGGREQQRVQLATLKRLKFKNIRFFYEAKLGWIWEQDQRELPFSTANSAIVRNILSQFPSDYWLKKQQNSRADYLKNWMSLRPYLIPKIRVELVFLPFFGHRPPLIQNSCP